MKTFFLPLAIAFAIGAPAAHASVIDIRQQAYTIKLPDRVEVTSNLVTLLPSSLLHPIFTIEVTHLKSFEFQLTETDFGKTGILSFSKGMDPAVQLAYFNGLDQNQTLIPWATYDLGDYTGTLTFSATSFSSRGDTVAELRNFNTVDVMAAVPEPETYAMLLAGMGLMGCIARRKSRTPPVVG